MPRVGIEPTTAVFERAKTLHALGRGMNTLIRIIDKPGQVQSVRDCMQLQHAFSVLPNVQNSYGEVGNNFHCKLDNYYHDYFGYCGYYGYMLISSCTQWPVTAGSRLKFIISVLNGGS
jgi:hypothetical protein